MGTILSPERAAGVDSTLWDLYSGAVDGLPFDVRIGIDGGVRLDAAKQLAFYLAGTSKAKTLSQTAHGRGGAIDGYPVDASTGKNITDRSAPEWQVYGAAIRSVNLKWGGDFGGTSGAGYDYPHAELLDWQSLPMPSLVEALKAKGPVNGFIDLWFTIVLAIVAILILTGVSYGLK